MPLLLQFQEFPLHLLFKLRTAQRNKARVCAETHHQLEALHAELLVLERQSASSIRHHRLPGYGLPTLDG